MDNTTNNNKLTQTPVYDVVMIGAGPSALAAAVYTTRENLQTVLYEKAVIGGLAAITDKIDNYPGFADGVAGLDLAEQLQRQAERFGAQIELGEVSSLRKDGNDTIVTVDGQDVRARAVLIATGSAYNKLGIPGEDALYGRGVHYCATCDGAFYKGKRLVVIGGGNSGLQEAMFLTRFAEHIDLLVRSTIKASEILQTDLQPFVERGQISVHLHTESTEIIAEDGKVTGVAAISNGQPTTFACDGVFVFVGLKPNTGFLQSTPVQLDERGLIITNEHLETTMPGVFASGDVRSGATMQIATAVGEGATAALSIREYIQQHKV